MMDRIRPLLATALAALVLAGAAPAACEAQYLRIRIPTGGSDRSLPGEPIERAVSVGQGISPVLGFSCGVAVEDELGEVVSAVPTAELLAANGGAPLDFLLIELLPEGFTVQATICAACPGWSTPFWGIPAIAFVVDPAPTVELGDSFSICFSDALGSPPVPVEVTSTTATTVPTTSCGTVCIIDHEWWEFAVVDIDVPYDRATGSVEFVATATIGEYPCGSPPIDHSPGFAFGIAHDPATLVALEVIAAPPIQAINDGDGPDYFVPEIFPNGITVGCVASFTGSDWFSFPGATDTALITYETVPAALIGAPAPVATTLAWTNSLGTPPVATIIMPGDASMTPQGLIDGTVTLSPVDAPHYIRGDLDEGGTVDIGDAIGLLAYLFQGGAAPWCVAAGDVDGSGGIDIGDPIEALQYLFAGGEPPRAPFPDCGAAGLADCPRPSAVCP